MSATLAPVIRQRFFTTNGAPLAGGKVYTYVAGTTTPQASYTDQSAGTPNANPVVLDANGEANIWFDPTLSYKVVLQDSLSVVQWTVDNVASGGGAGVASWSANTIYSQGAIVADTSGYGLLYVSLTNNNVGNVLSTVASWRALGGGERTVTSNATLAVTDEIVRSNSTAGALTHTLPVCSTAPIGKRITIKDVGSGGFATTVKGAGTDTVEGVVTYATTLKRYESLTVINNGNSWDIVAPVISDGSITTAKYSAGSVDTTALGSNAVTTIKLAAGAVTQEKLAASNYNKSASSGFFSTSSTTPVAITNLSLSLVTTGRVVLVFLQPDATGGSNFGATGANGDARIQLTCDASVIADFDVVQGSGNGGYPGAILCHFFVAAGTHTFAAQAYKPVVNGNSPFVNNMILVAIEL